MIPDQEEMDNVRGTFQAVSRQADNALKLLDSCVLARNEAESEVKVLQDRLASVLRERDDWRVRAESLERQFSPDKESTPKSWFKLILYQIYTVFSYALVIGLTIFFFALLADYFNA